MIAFFTLDLLMCYIMLISFLSLSHVCSLVVEVYYHLLMSYISEIENNLEPFYISKD